MTCIGAHIFEWSNHLQHPPIERIRASLESLATLRINFSGRWGKISKVRCRFHHHTALLSSQPAWAFKQVSYCDVWRV